MKDWLQAVHIIGAAAALMHPYGSCKLFEEVLTGSGGHVMPQGAGSILSNMKLLKALFAKGGCCHCGARSGE